MARAHAERERTDIRRTDRAVEDEAWIRALLHRAPMGTLATAHDGQPFVNSNLFVFDEAGHAIFMHTAPQGRTRANVSADERACFTVTEMGRLLPAPRAFNMSVEYASVVLFGRARVIEDAGEKRRALRMLVEKYFAHLRAGVDYEEITEQDLAQTAAYRIDIEEWTGKKKEAEPEFPGAFRWGSS
jgi:hypothetical protein